MAMASASVDPLPLGVFTVYSTQNAEQSALARRFEAMAMATQPSDGARVRVRSTELQGLQRDDGSEDTFRSVQWYRVLVRNAVISEIAVSLLDEDNHPVEFNGVPWCIKLALSLIHNKNVRPMLTNLINPYNGSQTRSPNADAVDEARQETRGRASPAARPPPSKRARRRQRKAAARRKNAAEPD